MNDGPDLTDAPPADAGSDELAEWVRTFLASPGSDNEELGEMLANRSLHWAGPLEIPLDELHRLAGPPDQPTVGRFDEEGEESVQSMRESVEDGWDPPPFVVTYNAEFDQFVVEDGNHRAEALRRAGKTEHACVVGFESAQQCGRVMASVGTARNLAG